MNPAGNTAAEIRSMIAAGRDVLPRVLSLLQLLVPDRPGFPFYIRSRVKTYDSFAKKIELKRLTKGDAYGPDSVTDVCGIRIVTLYDEQLLDTVELVTNLIFTGSTLPEPIFEGKSAFRIIREGLFFPRGGESPFRGDNANDIYLRCRDKFLDVFERHAKDLRKGGRVPPSFKKQFREVRRENTSYSSYHMVLNARSPVLHKKVPIELQVRTVTEDVWGEIDHELKYKARHPYIWSEDIEEAYDDLERDSHYLKEKLGLVPSTIEGFYKHSARVRERIATLRKPYNNYYISVPLTIIEQVGRTRYFTPELIKHLDSFKKLWEFPTSIGLQKGAGNLDEARTIIAKVPEHFTLAFHSDAATPARNLINCCLKFEEIRLDLLAMRLHNDPKSPEIQKKTRLLLDQLIELENDSRWVYKPRTVLKFWIAVASRDCKHSLARCKGLLLEAYREMQKDDSLTPWSIYRSLIPRQLTAIIRVEAKELTGNSGSAESPLQNEIRELAVEALGFANEAFIAYSEARRSGGSRYRGDLVYGFEKDSNKEDASNFVVCYKTCLNLQLSHREIFRMTGVRESDYARAEKIRLDSTSVKAQS